MEVLRLIKLIGILSILVGLSFRLNTWIAKHISVPKDQPNIIFILMDDLGYETAIQGDSMVGIGASKELHLPYMRQTLPPKALSLSNAYSSPVCTPSRVQVMTGEYLYKTYQQFGQLNWNSRTLAQNLLWNGYNTMVCGKWQLQGNTSNLFPSPSNHEADYSTVDFENPRRLGYKDYLLHAVEANGNIYSSCSKYFYEDGTPACGANDFGPYVVLDYIKDYIDANKDKNRPFFIDYRMLLPHDPFHPVPAHPDYPPDSLNMNNAYYLPEMITLTDSIIGAVIEHVDNTPELSEGAGTAVIVYSDNGSSRGWITNNPDGEPITGWGIFTRINGVGQFNGNKSLSTYLGCHVPAFAYYTGAFKKYGTNEVYDAPVGLIDVYATILDLAKLWYLGPKDGNSFADEIVTYVPDRTDREVLFQYYNTFRDVIANGRLNTNHNSFVTDGHYWMDSRGRFYNISDSLDWELRIPLDSLSRSPQEQAAYEVFDSILALHPKAEEFNKPLFTPH